MGRRLDGDGWGFGRHEVPWSWSSGLMAWKGKSCRPFSTLVVADAQVAILFQLARIFASRLMQRNM